MVVSHPGAPSSARDAAVADGATAQKAGQRKKARYPPEEVPGARLVAFSVETGGRWGDDALDFLKKAAGRGASPGASMSSDFEQSPAGGRVVGARMLWVRRLLPLTAVASYASP